MNRFPLKFSFVFLAVCLATWLIWARFGYPLNGIDDANIFLVYAKNLVHGHGFVYNVGGERVEGFSSLLWTLVCTVVFSFSSNPEFLLLSFNILILSLGATVAFSHVQSHFVNQADTRFAKYFWPLLFLMLLVSSPAYMLWNTITLMENALWGTLLLILTVVVIREDISSRVVYSVFIPLLILLLLTRPESFLWASVLTAILLVRKSLTGGLARALREMIPVFASIALTVVSLTIFRLQYFGYPLPNTYYAKVSPSLFYNLSRGIPYFVKYFISNPIVTISVLAVLLVGLQGVLLLVEKKFINEGSLFLPILGAVGLLAPVATGGDHFSSFRFYQSVYPILLLCLLYAGTAIVPQYLELKWSSAAWSSPRSLFVLGLVVLFMAGLVSLQARDWLLAEETAQMEVEFNIAQQGREQGQFLEDVFADLPELPSIGVVRAGGIKYMYPGEIIDLMGLNNLSMGHNGGSRLGEKNHAAFEKSTFYQLQPDLLSVAIVSKADWQYKARDLQQSWDNSVPLKRLYDDTAFLQLYVYAKVERKDHQAEKALVGWFRKDFLTSLESSGDFLVERYPYPDT